ncbi:hypothetical protein [Microtetraspora sp. NBRC 16547]|uniref:hypothetical protein n=1 Tax=Microtetraspora sp. NBRC 16547 TaxID=3030993 RepID=UPI0025548490|nr:hypothetical protein [Microtetraspora sp. NBRC 16547]
MTIGTLRQTPHRILDWALPYWTRGEAGRETPAELFRVLYLGWLAAFVLKMLGASWDVSWHFRWLRDDLAPPHLLNTVGTVIAVGLTIVHWYTGYGVDRLASRLIVWGTGVFLIAIPLDLINHRVNGLDITAWSPSHALLFIGSGLMIAGVTRGWWLGAPRGDARAERRRTLVLGALFVFFLENLHFPAQQQEYGVLEIASWDRGDPYAEPSLLEFAANQLGRAVDREMIVKFSLPVPDLLYPLWAGVAGMLVLVIARLMVGRAWTATAVAAAYVGYRALVWPLFVGMGFPASAVPFFFVLGAVGVDLAFMGCLLLGDSTLARLVRPVLGAALVTAGIYGGLALQSKFLSAPPYPEDSWPMAAGLLAAVWIGAEILTRMYRLRDGDRDQETGARVSATATP